MNFEIKQSLSDTIVAQATPPGYGGISVIRISGDNTVKVAQQVLGQLPSARYAHYLSFYDEKGRIIDKGITLWFPAPNSFTGENVLELHSHGSPIVIDMLLKIISNIPDVRIAKPGEFTERAFLNNKIDLVQAEAIADLINATSEQAARSALNSLQGVFSDKIRFLANQLTNLRIYLESSINFPNEYDINSLSKDEIVKNLNKIIQSINDIHTISYQGTLLREGRKVIIIGAPNVGKSTIFNNLAGKPSAIVTNYAGTTRDMLHEYINIEGMPLHIIDTAGLHKTNNYVENIGIQRAIEEINIADHIILVTNNESLDLTADLSIIFPDFFDKIPQSVPLTIINNVTDITKYSSSKYIQLSDRVIITISAKTGQGIELLCDHLKKSMGNFNTNEGIFMARQRHLQALSQAMLHLEQGKQEFIKNHAYSYDLLAEELRLTQNALSNLIGDSSSQDLLEKIFSKFCIGK
ncbi:MAG: tRNA uridine-5-carboxymethylaminomethyl(34) synthesis GTPase MnmE [Candidatus Dasytiphilus stammeri]